MTINRNTGLGTSDHRRPLYIDDSRAMVEYKRFSTDYFSGCDCKIYFDDVYVDTVMALQLSLSENVMPVYGYKSYTYDAIARGNRIVKGSFRIAFKESYYLHSIIEQMNSKREAGTTKKEAFTFVNSYKENTIEALLATADNPSRFKELANQYEESIWGKGNDSFTERIGKQSHTTYFVPEERNRKIHNEGFSIMIAYGNIDRGISQINQNVNGTIENIVGVQLMEVGKIIDPSGQPIMEEYSFLARDINANLVKD